MIIFPLINCEYKYDNNNVVVWASDIFRKVYIRSTNKKDNYQYNAVNWFKFIFNAIKIGKINTYSEVY